MRNGPEQKPSVNVTDPLIGQQNSGVDGKRPLLTSRRIGENITVSAVFASPSPRPHYIGDDGLGVSILGSDALVLKVPDPRSAAEQEAFEAQAGSFVHLPLREADPHLSARREITARLLRTSLEDLGYLDSQTEITPTELQGLVLDAATTANAIEPATLEQMKDQGLFPDPKRLLEEELAGLRERWGEDEFTPEEIAELRQAEIDERTAQVQEFVDTLYVTQENVDPTLIEDAVDPERNSVDSDLAWEKLVQEFGIDQELDHLLGTAKRPGRENLDSVPDVTQQVTQAPDPDRDEGSPRDPFDAMETFSAGTDGDGTVVGGISFKSVGVNKDETTLPSDLEAQLTASRNTQGVDSVLWEQGANPAFPDADNMQNRRAEVAISELLAGAVLDDVRAIRDLQAQGYTEVPGVSVEELTRETAARAQGLGVDAIVALRNTAAARGIDLQGILPDESKEADK